MEQLAERLGIGQSALSRIERGKFRPGWETLDAILRETGGAVTPNDFIEEPIEISKREGVAA